MVQAETRLYAEHELAASPLGVRLFRNQTGSYKLADGRWLSSGIGGEGGSDLVGYTPLRIQAHHVGQTLAIFTAIEVKVPGAYTKPDRLIKQSDFLIAVNSSGGLGFFSDDPQAAAARLRQFQGR